MLFSVIVPMYNAEKYIADCIDSVINQTFKEFELIIINDGSKDSSLEIAKNYSKFDNRIKIIDQENKGLFHTRCVGIKNSKGDYLVFLDADDRLKLNALEILSLEILNGNYDMIIYTAEFLYENGKTKPFTPLYDGDFVFQGTRKTDLYKKILKGNRLNNIWIKAIRANCFEVDKFINYPKITMGEDLLHTLYPITNAKKIKYINKILYQYRINASSMTRNFQPDVYEGHKKIYLEIKNMLKKWDMDNKEYNSILNNRFLKSIGKAILFSPANIINRENEYLLMLESINMDSLFYEIYNEQKNHLENHIKFSLYLLVNKKYRILLILKKIIVILRGLLKK